MSSEPNDNGENTTHVTNFIRNIIDQDLQDGINSQVVTRFPPEPNGYLHIGHAKSICLNFGLARKYEGTCHLRFDDTNPLKESQEYLDAIREDVSWLGFSWGEHEYYASSYFEQLYEWACELIRADNAYVDDLTAEEIRTYRGTLKEPGKESPFRNRSVEENLDLFQRMKEGEFADGSKVLRAKIDMAAANINLRDPVMYRIMRAEHHRTGNSWCLYPMYDFAHGQSDSIEGITYSICTLEFEDHRPLYNWFLEQLKIHHPRQIEFSRLNLSYTVMSKRKLLELVEDNIVDGWDDPRMPTISGMRRRGFTPASIRNFCDRIGIGKSESWIDMSVLEDCLREDLNETAPRVMGVLDPLKVVITNYPEGESEIVVAKNHPQKPEMGTRELPFSKEIYIERSDFMENPPRKFHRLGHGREVRLRYAYFITCTDVIKDATGEIKEIHCTYDPETRGGSAPDGRKVKGTIHWVSAADAVTAHINMYDRLFSTPYPGRGDRDYREDLNPESRQVLTTCKLEPGLKNAVAGQLFQFERQGYFCLDKTTTGSASVFNRTVTLRDSWANRSKG